MDEMERVTGSDAPYDLARLDRLEAERVVGAIVDSKAVSTRRAYAAKWHEWVRWCADHDRIVMPAEPSTVAAWFTELADAGRSVSTINIAAAALRARHEMIGYPDPTAAAVVRRTRAGLTRRLGIAPRHQAHPLSVIELRRMVETCRADGVRGARDRALLLVGYAAALRRSEIAALRVEHLTRLDGGVVVHLPRSKSDQEGRGVDIGVARGEHTDTCPVTALAAWTDLLGETSGPLFPRINRYNTLPLTPRPITGATVDQIIKRRADAAGLSDLAISGHSLRAGHATTAAEHGVDASRIARTTRHARLETLARYVRPAEVLADTTSRDLGL
jgi:integrase